MCLRVKQLGGKDREHESGADLHATKTVDKIKEKRKERGGGNKPSVSQK
jgi:hypothetical protein